MGVIHKIGRRKCAVARVYVSEGTGKITVNKREFSNYFPTATLQYKVMQQKNPALLVEKAVKGMLPKNKLGAQLFRNLNVNVGSEHKHAAQQPKTVNLNDLK